MLRSLARILRLAARYAENPRAFTVRQKGGISGTFWKLDSPWFHQLGIKTVIDVGANDGQFSITARALLPSAKIFAFEPIPDCHKRVSSKFGRDTQYKIYNIALGAQAGEAELTIASGDTGASSLLPFDKAQQQYFPHTLNSRKVTVPVRTLDDTLSSEELVKPYLLKIDVQGFEYEVIKGATQVLQGAAVLILEASYEPFYQGQKLFDDVYDLLRARGFRLRDTFNMMQSPDTGEVLQGDFIFLRRENREFNASSLP